MPAPSTTALNRRLAKRVIMGAAEHSPMAERTTTGALQLDRTGRGVLRRIDQISDSLVVSFRTLAASPRSALVAIAVLPNRREISLRR